jgi:mannose-6-phosphate isomerase-like protein (cupin superfamily)
VRVERVAGTSAKGWWAGAWNSPLPIAVGYATMAIDDPHVHQRVSEIYLVATGSSTLRIEKQSVKLESGDMIIVDPGEAHTFTESSADYLHFVLHSPSLPAVEHQQERIAVPRSRLAL